MNNLQQFSSVVRPLGSSNAECGYCKGSRAYLLSIVEGNSSSTQPSTTTTPATSTTDQQRQENNNNNNEGNSSSASSCCSSPASTTTTTTTTTTTVSSSRSYGMLAERLSPKAYEDFCYRGWRRSGIHLYKPDNFASCCPTLTIRCNVNQFIPTKSQSKILRRLRTLSHPPINTITTTTLSTTSNHPRRQTSIHHDGNHPTLPVQNPSDLTTGNHIPPSTTSTPIMEIIATFQEMTRLAFAVMCRSNILPSDITIPPIVYRVKPSTKVQQKNRILILTCNICAILAGRNHDQGIPREKLLDALLTQLQRQVVETTSSSSTATTTALSSSSEVQMTTKTLSQVLSIDSHPQSGYIIVAIQYEEQEDEHTKLSTQKGRRNGSHMSLDDINDPGDDLVSNGIASKNVADSPPTSPVTEASQDKLGKWYQQTTGRPLRADQRDLSIVTLTAYESALNPKVHELYMLYQHRVHQDPNPLQAKEEDNGNSINNDNDDNRNGENEDVITREIANFDWGSHCPPHFVEQVTEMLHSYLSPHPIHIQGALLSNYFDFYHFLVESPFSASGQTGTTTSDSLELEGCHHQQYWIGDVLIGVGVVDILLNGLSSVYFFYHPDTARSIIPLGKLASLKEIEYTRDVLRKPYYYLGYYIESCQKMRYKADYYPSELLCPIHYEWVDSQSAIPKLQATLRGVCALVNDNRSTTTTRIGRDDDTPTTLFGPDSDLSRIPLDIRVGIPITLDMLNEDGKNQLRPILQEYYQAAGPEISRMCLLKLVG